MGVQCEKHGFVATLMNPPCPLCESEAIAALRARIAAAEEENKRLRVDYDTACNVAAAVEAKRVHAAQSLLEIYGTIGMEKIKEICERALLEVDRKSPVPTRLGYQNPYPTIQVRRDSESKSECLERLKSESGLRARPDDGRVERVREVLRAHGWSNEMAIDVVARGVLEAADGAERGER